MLVAWANQGPPFEQIVEALKPKRDASHNPIFQVMFVLQNTPAASWEFGGLHVSPVSLESRTVEFDILLELYEEREGLRVRFSYNAGLFEESRIRRMGDQYLVLLEEIARDPGTLVASIPLVRPDDRARVIRNFNEALDHETASGEMP
jgi:non-ribosomal peptide synthetase component F